MKRQAKITIKTERTIMLPMVPNFLRTEGDDAIPVETLTQDQLREIGQQWTEALMRKAQLRKAESIRKINKLIQSGT